MALDDMTDVQLAWLAGIIDGEGCIRVSFSKNCYSAGVIITNTDKLMMDTIISLTGLGKVHLQRRKDKSKDCLYWDIYSNKDILDLLTRMLPYLVVKKVRARICIDFCKLKLNYNGQGDKLEFYYSVMSMLNKRGVVEEEEKNG